MTTITAPATTPTIITITSVGMDRDEPCRMRAAGSSAPSPTKVGEGGAKRRMGCGKQDPGGAYRAETVVQSAQHRSVGPHPIRRFAPPSPATPGKERHGPADVTKTERRAPSFGETA